MTRRRLRAVLLIAMTPVAIVGIVAAVWLIRPVLVEGGAIAAYEGGLYGSSEDSSSQLVDQFIVEPWIPYFDRGDALIGQQDYIRATDDFEKALALAPADRECMVRVNLARTWEALGDEYEAGGFHEGAAKLYAAGKQVLAAAQGRCDDDPETQQTQQELEAKQYYAQLLQQAQDAGGSQQSQQDKLDDLGGREQQGQQELNDGRARDQQGQGSGSTSTDRPW